MNLASNPWPISSIRLRPWLPSDEETLYEIQRDPVANEMAAMKPRPRDEFAKLFQLLLNDSAEAVARAILQEERVVGLISGFKQDAETSLGYWIAREVWGRGIGSAAIPLFLLDFPVRPLYAKVASTNVGSIRLLEKNGFQFLSEEYAEASGRYLACMERTYRLSICSD